MFDFGDAVRIIDKSPKRERWPARAISAKETVAKTTGLAMANGKRCPMTTGHRRISDSAEKPSVHPSRASEPLLSLSKERTEEPSRSMEILPFMLPVEAFLRFFSRINILRSMDLRTMF